MSSILEFLRDLCCCCCGTKDPSDALFAAGVEAWRKYEETGELQQLAEAVRNYQEALNLRLQDHPRRPESLLHTAMALWAQCHGAVTKESSSTVIAYYDEALRLLPDKLESRATVYTNLGMVYLTLFRLGKENPEAFPATGSNLGKAIENYQSALQLRPTKNDPNRPISLINLSIALVEKDSKDDLMNAIINLREAVELCTTKPTNRRLLLSSLNNLAQAYDRHYNYSEDIRDVVEKVAVLRRVVDLTDEGKGRLVPLINLTNALWRLCGIEHQRRNDLDEAVLHGQKALKLSDASNKATHVKALTTLANVLSARYEQISPKNVKDLDQAIQCYRAAIDPDPEYGPDPILCSSLASAISIRCQDFEEVEGATLEDAISYNQDALHTCPDDDPLYLRIQNNLGCIYLTQFNKSESGAEGYLVKAIQAYEDVVSHCRDDNDDLADYQKSLKDAKGALQHKREGRTDKVSLLIRHQSTSVTTRKRSSQSDSPSTSRSPTKRESSFTAFTSSGQPRS